MSRIKTFLDNLFNSPYLSKIDVAAALTAAVLLFHLPLSPVQQASAVLLLGVAYMAAKAVEGALPSK